MNEHDACCQDMLLSQEPTRADAYAGMPPILAGTTMKSLCISGKPVEKKCVIGSLRSLD
ncbi:MAG TPA: hypothetical protein VJ577_05845 [Burkholderiaceae bacterium]|nr:hypothetical protein [Burkholderiaceae bacterium]